MKTTRNTPRAADRRRTHRHPYALRSARLMARMARDGDTAELAEMIAEMVTVEPPEEPVLAAETAGASAAGHGRGFALTPQGPSRLRRG